MSGRWPLLILFIAVLARVGIALTVGDQFHFPDEAAYVDAATRLSEGDGFGFTYTRVPAYPVFLALLSLGIPASLTFLRVSQAAVAALCTLLVIGLADRLFGRRTALVAGLVFALDPLLVISSGLLYPEPVAALLLSAIVLIALQSSERDEPARSVLTGALLGILALLRPVALVLPPVVAAWIGLSVAASPLRRISHVGLLGLSFLLVLAPWVVRNYRVHGALIPVATAGSNTAPAEQEEVARNGLVTTVARSAWREPGTLIKRVAQQFVQFWELTPTRLMTDDPAKRERFHRRDPRLSVQPLFSRGLRDRVSAWSFAIELCLALVGIVAAVRTRWRQAALPVAIILTYALGYALFVAKLRYRIPVLPLLFLFTGLGSTVLWSLLRRALVSQGRGPGKQ